MLEIIYQNLWDWRLPACMCVVLVLKVPIHYIDVIMATMASQITSLTVVYSTVYSDADQRKHQSSASLAFVWGIHRDRWIPRTKGQLRGKMFPFDDVIMLSNFPKPIPGMQYLWTMVVLYQIYILNCKRHFVCKFGIEKGWFCSCLHISFDNSSWYIDNSGR